MVYTITVPMLYSPFVVAVLGFAVVFVTVRAVIRIIDLVGV